MSFSKKGLGPTQMGKGLGKQFNAGEGNEDGLNPLAIQTENSIEITTENGQDLLQE